MTPLHDHADRCFSLAELVAAASELCGRLPAQGDERVRSVPDERTVRYYQSVGLVDRPLRYEGRVAAYGFRHLLQVVAVKALQGEGLSLAQVQAALAARSTPELEAAVSQAVGAPVAPAVPPARPRPNLTWALAPGVWLTLDPEQVPDPEALVALLSNAIHLRKSP